MKTKLTKLTKEELENWLDQQISCNTQLREITRSYAKELNRSYDMYGLSRCDISTSTWDNGIHLWLGRRKDAANKFYEMASLLCTTVTFKPRDDDNTAASFQYRGVRVFVLLDTDKKEEE